jgi:hypothetical protein
MKKLIEYQLIRITSIESTSELIIIKYNYSMINNCINLLILKIKLIKQMFFYEMEINNTSGNLSINNTLKYNFYINIINISFYKWSIKCIYNNIISHKSKDKFIVQLKKSNEN